MRIKKYLHSCLIIEEESKVFLIDPGNFTYQEKALDLTKLNQLDYILITHEHPDHCHIPFIKEILAKFPEVEIISNESVVTKLRDEQIEATTEAPAFITIESVPHEDVVLAVPPENIQFTIFNKFTDPGDSHHVKHTAPVLALPIQAPWGSFADALKLAEELSPKYVIPIHDWHWKDEVRKSMYQRAKEYLAQSDIAFISLETGEPHEL
jgi:L-ascorbate metabolism protein UlaG (beta-lactamase superfamily)